MTAESITNGRHMLLTTYRKNGVGVSSPVWTVAVSDGRVGMWTGSQTAKFKRLRHDPHVTIQSCSARGKLKSNSTPFEGTAEIVENGPLFDEVQSKIHAKYHWMIPLVTRISRLQGRYTKGEPFGDRAILITVAAKGEG